jgi:hypothetical protein
LPEKAYSSGGDGAASTRNQFGEACLQHHPLRRQMLSVDAVISPRGDLYDLSIGLTVGPRLGDYGADGARLLVLANDAMGLRWR